MSVSNELVWGIVRDTSCFLLKRKLTGRTSVSKGGPEFTTEPNNLTGINSWKYSGLANSKTIGLDATPEGTGVVLTTKSTVAADAKKPNKALKKVTYTASRSLRRMSKTIKKETASKFYRPDLQKAALAKWSLLYAAQKKAKAKA